MARAALTQERLRALLNYDPDTGIFTRRVGVQGFAAAYIVVNGRQIHLGRFTSRDDAAAAYRVAAKAKYGEFARA